MKRPASSSQMTVKQTVKIEFKIGKVSIYKGYMTLDTIEWE